MFVNQCYTDVIQGGGSTMEILKSLSYPEEALALMKYRFGGCSALTQNFDPVSIHIIISVNQ